MSCCRNSIYRNYTMHYRRLRVKRLLRLHNLRIKVTLKKEEFTPENPMALCRLEYSYVFAWWMQLKITMFASGNHFLSYVTSHGRVTSMTLDISPWQGPWGGESAVSLCMNSVIPRTGQQLAYLTSLA